MGRAPPAAFKPNVQILDNFYMASILIVDDQPAVRDTIAACLADERHDIVTAANGQEAIEVLESRAVDVIFSDILMPEMDGLEFFRRLRASDSNAQLVALTGGATFLDGNNLLEVADALGARETLHKPLRRQELRDCLERVLAGDQPS